MKQYLVIRMPLCEGFMPSVVFQTDIGEDCPEFAAIMHRADGCEYRCAVLEDTLSYTDIDLPFEE